MCPSPTKSFCLKYFSSLHFQHSAVFEKPGVPIFNIPSTKSQLHKLHFLSTHFAAKLEPQPCYSPPGSVQLKPDSGFTGWWANCLVLSSDQNFAHKWPKFLFKYVKFLASSFCKIGRGALTLIHPINWLCEKETLVQKALFVVSNN